MMDCRKIDFFLPISVLFENYPSFTNSGNANSGLYNLVRFSSIFMLGLGSILGFVPIVDGYETTKVN